MAASIMIHNVLTLPLLLVLAFLLPPAPVTCNNILPPGGLLTEGQSLVSPNGMFELIFQAADRNLVLYHGVTPLWASNTANIYYPGSVFVSMDVDGQLTFRTVKTNYYLATMNPGPYCPEGLSGHLEVRDVGNFVIFCGPHDYVTQYTSNPPVSS
ncbi:hypothetical protein O6H91_05G030400 [Diphasiastrum complanatum]|uniref:Uncharacterized protein n=1 Tax=Diphasiastrum complanatum TaxID=34168 RepID=A0ACC2DMB7_DIPCM|nr:hypothetical protein O6H91_05G030400 [Diphasiastrum complanatum]